MTKFKIGQKVMCIQTFNVKRRYMEKYPMKSRIYTIRGFVNHNGQIGILLEEIVNPKYQYVNGYAEAAFAIQNFRSLDYQSATTEIMERFPLTEEKSDVKIKKTTKQEQIINKQINK